tara:strand:- start:138 stop:1658 length:1521 start_codon:yes stop_codon:yes gene_type:complete
MRFPILPSAVLATLLALPTVSPAAPQKDGWPFGATTAFEKRDLFNLGPLGAKASDEINGEPERGATGRRSVQLDPGAGGPDVGPERLKIEILFPGGPAATAGLQVGDVLIGAGGKKFNKGSFEPLADGIVKAMSDTSDGVLKLQIERDGKKENLEVTLPAMGKAFSKPTTDKGRAPVIERSLAWLAERQRPDGGFPETLGGATGAVVATSVAGLAWIAGGSNLENGPHAGNLATAWKFVVENAGKQGPLPKGDANWNQENWAWVHAGIFLGELYAQSPNDDLESGLETVKDGILRGVETTGGFGHGPGGPNALGYVELNIMTGLALSGLGMCQRAGLEVDEDIVKSMMEYIDASSSGGGVGYSTNDGQVGQGNIGRSAITWLGYRNLGLGKSKMGKSLGSYVKGNVDAYMDGHASLMQHILFAGVAAQAQGGGAEKSYWSAIERDMILAMGPDGSFQPRPWAESISMASNSDVSFGDVWTTACWSIVLACKPDKEGTRGLPVWLAK